MDKHVVSDVCLWKPTGEEKDVSLFRPAAQLARHSMRPVLRPVLRVALLMALSVTLLVHAPAGGQSPPTGNPVYMPLLRSTLYINK